MEEGVCPGSDQEINGKKKAERAELTALWQNHTE